MGRALAITLLIGYPSAVGAAPAGWSVDPAGFSTRARLLRMMRRQGPAAVPHVRRRGSTVIPYARRRRPALRPSAALAEKQLVVRTMRAEWTRLGIRPDQQAAFLTIAWNESRITLDARSAGHLPDAKNGHSWGVFQMGRRTLEDLGIRVASLMVRRRADGSATHSEVVRASRASARAAVAYVMVKSKRSKREPWLTHTLRRTGRRHDAVAREMFVVWSGGLSRRWSDVRARIRTHPEEARKVGSLGYIHTQVERRMRSYNRVFRPALRGRASRYARR